MLYSLPDSVSDKISECKAELESLFSIVQRLRTVIQNAETGAYSGGRGFLKIPDGDKPALPNRQTHRVYD